MPDEKPTVVEALAAVMEEVRAVAKDDRNGQQGYNFRGVDAVVNAAGPIFRKHKVIVMPICEEASYRDVQTSTGKPSRECTVMVRYRFYGPAGDFVEAVTPGESMDFGDKGAPKAMSVAFRIALIQGLCLPTHEPEPDAVSYERAAPVARQRQTQKAESVADKARAELRKLCEEKAWPASRVSAVFEHQYEQVLKTTDDAGLIEAFTESLKADPERVLGAA